MLENSEMKITKVWKFMISNFLSWCSTFFRKVVENENSVGNTFTNKFDKTARSFAVRFSHYTYLLLQQQ